MKIKVLFVCLGNICRSPTAHGVFLRKLEQSVTEDGRCLAELVEVDSAGTADWHVGKTPDTRSQMAARKRDYDLSSLRARQVANEDFEDFDFILAMDKANLQTLLERCPRPYRNKLALFLDFAEGPELEVPDPYYGGVEGFNQVLDLVEAASDGLIRRLLSRF
jgi:protein-tyrosine phosphatase